MLTGCEDAADCLDLRGSWWGTVNVGIGYPGAFKSRARCTGVEIDFPTGTGPIGLVKATELLGHATFKEVAEVVQAVKGIESAPLPGIARGNPGGVGIDLSN